MITQDKEKCFPIHFSINIHVNNVKMIQVISDKIPFNKSPMEMKYQNVINGYQLSEKINILSATFEKINAKFFLK